MKLRAFIAQGEFRGKNRGVGEGTEENGKRGIPGIYDLAVDKRKKITRQLVSRGRKR